MRRDVKPTAPARQAGGRAGAAAGWKTVDFRDLSG